ncbi:hypothetical protein RUM43_004558 [Polyplax serrata]|uniref:CFA20 domain-containing protein n=1 Tax=Polyplax serrata TaxID=468196 RepID=A0AAN8SDF0_POLSC
MFTRIIQPGLLCVLDADQEKPLRLWDKKIRDGQIKRTVSDEIKGLVLDMTSKMPMTSYIQCPASIKQSLGIHYPYLHIIVKLSFSTMFAFDVQVTDEKNVKRRFRLSTIYTYADIQPFSCKLPLTLENGWNQICVPLHHLVKNIYGTGYVDTNRLAIYPNCLLKRVYFSDREYNNEDVPTEFHIEDMDLSENYRQKYTSLVTQKRKSSLSYYPDLISEKERMLGTRKLY